jgi:hypothetical protein
MTLLLMLHGPSRRRPWLAGLLGALLAGGALVAWLA